MTAEEFAALSLDAKLNELYARAALVLAKTNLIGVAAVSWASPWAEDEEGEITLTLHAGADYSGTAALPAGEVTGWTGRDLDGVDAEFRLIREADWRSADATAALEVNAVLSQSGTTVSYTFELTSAQTAALTSMPTGGEYRWQIVVTDAHPFVLAGAGASTKSGRCRVLKMIGGA